MQLFQLKKVTKPGQCEAMRCTGECGPITMPEMLWVGDSNLMTSTQRRVELCVKHQAMAEDFANKNGFPLEESEQAGASSAIVVRESEGAKLTGFAETKGGASAWLARVYEVVQELEESLTDGKEVVDLVKGLSIETHADLETVGTFAQDVQAQIKATVALEKEITAPIATALARIRDHIKPTKTIWADAMVLLRAKLEAAALKQEARNKAAQAEATALAEAGEDPTAAIERMTNTADLAGVSLKLKWRAEVVDAKLMPDEYVIRIPNEKKLKEYCAEAEGEPEPMAGVKFVRDVDSRIQATKA